MTQRAGASRTSSVLGLNAKPQTAKVRPCKSSPNRRSTMSASDRRALTLGAAIVVPSLFFVFAVKPYRAALADVRQQLAVERVDFARERAAVSAAKRNPQMQHVADSAMQAMAPRLFAGRDDVMASAEVATYLGEVARASHVWLQDASTRPATSRTCISETWSTPSIIDSASESSRLRS